MITAHVHEFDKQYCVYEHWLTRTEPAEITLMLIGCCKLSEAFIFPAARRNSEWQKKFTRDVLLTVRIVSQHDNLMHAQLRVAQLVKEHRPHCNIHGHATNGRTIVTCNETGETFGSVLEAARVKGMSQSQLNNHINRMPGFDTVKGFTFRRGL